MSLDDADDGRVFNQFEGKRSTYKEDLYTTKIDQNSISDDLKKKAAQLERDILSQASGGNVHLAEERMQLNQKDEDETDRYEEMKYSGVYRQGESQQIGKTSSAAPTYGSNNHNLTVQGTNSKGKKNGQQYQQQFSNNSKNPYSGANNHHSQHSQPNSASGKKP